MQLTANGSGEIGRNNDGEVKEMGSYIGSCGKAAVVKSSIKI